MKAQACKFLRTAPKVMLKSQLKWEDGIAIVSEGFSGGGVDFIIDSKGKKLKSVYKWRLIEGPMAYLDTEYAY